MSSDYIRLQGLLDPWKPLRSQKEGAFECKKCKKRYIQKQTLNRHVQYECGKQPQFQCTWCGHRAKQKANLLTHLRNRHLTQLNEMLQCTGDISSFFSKVTNPMLVEWIPICLTPESMFINMNIQARWDTSGVSLTEIYHKVISLILPLCHMLLRRQCLWSKPHQDDNLDQPIIELLAGLDRRTKAAPYVCLKCGKTYCEKRNLWRHEKYECGQLPRFVCPYCKRGFKHKHVIENHLKCCKCAPKFPQALSV
ncbi:hypothetical protein J6590_002378 [Homalodisca vitripennis]|nr:hypothetical protein J6590_002378 [Homalodisca vitripennis]